MKEPPPQFAAQAGGVSDGASGPAGTIAIGTVTTLEAGQPATVENVGTSTAAILNFGLPKGNAGLTSLGPSLYVMSTADQDILDYSTGDPWPSVGVPIVFASRTLGGQASVQNKHRGEAWGGLYADSVVDITDRPIYDRTGGSIVSYSRLHDEYCMFQPGYVPLGGPLYSWDATYGPQAYMNCWKSGFYLVEATVTFESNATGWRALQICESTYNSDGSWSGPEVRAATMVPAVNGGVTCLTCSVSIGVDGHYKCQSPSEGSKRLYWGAGQISMHVRQNSGGSLKVLGSTVPGSEPRLSVTYMREQYDYWWDSNTPVEP